MLSEPETPATRWCAPADPAGTRPRRLAWVAVLAAGLMAATAASGLPLQACRLKGVEHAAQCGVLKRPLDPTVPDGPTIDLHVAVLPALSRHKHPDPVFFFAGGPGQSAIDLAGPVGRLLGRFANRRDLVLIDQRGTGRSAPLRCEGDDRPQRPLAESVDPAVALRSLARCRQALERLPHGDLRRYTTSIAMLDTEAVRKSLGLGRINLVGASYGTRAALEYLRQFPRSVRRVVLDGVAPPDMALPASFATDAQAALDALFAWCRADDGCRQLHPQLDERWRRLRDTLPRDVDVVHPLTGQVERLRLTPGALAGLVRAVLYAPSLAAALPAALADAADGRWAPLVGLSAALAGTGAAGALAQGQHFSVVCAEDGPRVDGAAPAAPTDFGGGLTDLYRQACLDWPRGEVPAAFYTVPASASPVLLMSGAADPVTPARHGQRVAQALGPRARHLVVPNAGHGLLGLGCLRDLAFRFIDAPEDDEALALDLGCAREVPRPLLFNPPGAGATR